MGKVSKKDKIRRNLILRSLFEQGPLSLTDLSKSTGITIPVLKKVLTKIKKEGFVERIKSVKTNGAGRPPIYFKLSKQGGCILGIDIGRTFTNYILLDLEKNIVNERRIKTLNIENPEEFIEEIYNEVLDFLKETNVPLKKLLGVGIAIPGVVRTKEGISETYLKFKNKTVREAFQEKFNKPIQIEHDAKAMALGELWFGKAKGLKNVLCLNLGWGIGLGIIIDGKIYYGNDGFSGEFGHIQVVPEGDVCYCGKYGCLETVASGRAITEIAKKKVLEGKQTILTQKPDFKIEDVDAIKIIEAANQGDQFSLEILEEAGDYIGSGIAYLINLFNPEKIIFGGGITLASKFIIDSIISTAMKKSLTHINKSLTFEISDLGFRAGAIGVAMLAVKDLFEVEHLQPIKFV